MAKNTVHYCPGSASGSPAWLPEEQARRQLAQDTLVIELLQRIDSSGEEPVYLPHIGGTCGRCQQLRENR